MPHKDLNRLREQVERITPSEPAGDPAYERTLEAAMKFLDRKRYTVFELALKLKEKDIGTKKVRGAVIRRLQELKLLDDLEYACSWIRTRSTLNPKGAYLLRAELQKKKIDPAIIEEALQSTLQDEYPLAEEIVRKKITHIEKLPFDARYHRIMSLLQRRGFSYDTARRAWESQRKK